jgi:hypothetical protein
MLVLGGPTGSAVASEVSTNSTKVWKISPVGSHTKNIQNQFLDLLSSARIVAQPETIASERLPGSSFPVPPSEAAAPHVSSPAPRENSLIPLIPIEIKNLPNSADNFSEIDTLSLVGKDHKGCSRLQDP